MMRHVGWETLLSLNGVTMVIDEHLGFWVKFVAYRVQPSRSIPHGVRYSLTLHDRRGTRRLGFDNAHGVNKTLEFDHWHRSSDDSGRKYDLDSPESLLEDFWREVDRVLRESQDD
nr:hypothetical protein NCPCFENI_00663 [Cupriavidus sp.]